MTLRGRKMKPPQYYINLMKVDNPSLYDDIKHKRLDYNKKLTDQTWERLETKEKVKKLNLKKLQKKL